MNPKQTRQRLDGLKAEHAALKRSVKQERLAVASAEDALADAETARDIIQVVGETMQRLVHEKLAGVVTDCLATVFEEPYEFRAIFEKKRNQTEARLVLVRDGVEFDPMDATGGGVVDVAAFALRLASIMLRRPRVRRLLVMDEPFRFVSAQYRPKVRLMLESLSEQMNVQIIMVTHIPELVTGKVVELV